jgi:hypothetical protein
VQTFLPYPDFVLSARALDDRRLGKQRVEAHQIRRALLGVTTGWRNHPATLMWEGRVAALGIYTNAMIDEWIRRGFRNTMRHCPVYRGQEVMMPTWMGLPDFHARHRSNLLRKDPDHYGKFGWTESPDMEYLWPGGGV